MTRGVRSVASYFKKGFNKTKKRDAYVIVDLFSFAVLVLVRTVVMEFRTHTATLMYVLGGRLCVSV